MRHGWPLRPLGRCAKFLSGGTPSKAVPEYWEGDIPWVSSGEMTQTRIHDTPLRITVDAAQAGSRLVPANTVLGVVRGMSLANEFRVAITKREVAFNQDLKAFACEPDVDPEFLFYALLARRESIRDLSTEASHGTKKLETQVLADFRIAVPDIDIQRRAVRLISAYGDLIENNRRRMVLLEKAARLLYEDWFVRLRFPGHERARFVEGIPYGWDRKPLAMVAEVNRATLPSSFDGEIEYVDIASVAPGEITETTSHSFREAPSRARRIVQHGDVIWSCVRPNRRSHAIIWRPAEHLIVSTGFAVITPAAVPSTFLYFTSTTDAFVGYLENHARGAAYPAVVGADFERAEVLVPAKRLLDLFDETVEPSFSQIHNLRHQNQKLKTARDLLLPRLMGGELSV
jgi:type I restriction enzyme S subunit